MTHRFESQYGDDYQTEQRGLQPSLRMLPTSVVYVVLCYLTPAPSPPFSWRTPFSRFIEPLLTMLQAILCSHKQQHLLSCALPLPASSDLSPLGQGQLGSSIWVLVPTMLPPMKGAVSDYLSFFLFLSFLLPSPLYSPPSPFLSFPSLPLPFSPLLPFTSTARNRT